MINLSFPYFRGLGLKAKMKYLIKLAMHILKFERATEVF